MRNASARVIKIDPVLSGECLDLRVLLEIFRRDILNVVIDGENRLGRVSDLRRANLVELRDYGAGVVVGHHMARTNRNKIATANHLARSESIRVACSDFLNEREAHTKTLNNQLSTINYWESFLCRAFTKKLGDIEIYEICMMKDDRLDRALHLIAFMTVRGDDVHHFAGNPMLVGQRDAAERMPHLLAKFALDHFA